MRTVKRALSLLKADQGLRDREIADVLLVNPATVARARKRYVEEGPAINDRPWPGQERKLDGRQEAHLIAFACTPRPKVTRIGHSSCWPTRWWSWSLPRASPWRRCARYELKPWKKKEWCIPKVSRGADGGRAGPVLQSGASGSVFRRLQAIDWGGASAHRGCPRTGGTL